MLNIVRTTNKQKISRLSLARARGDGVEGKVQNKREDDEKEMSIGVTAPTSKGRVFTNV